MIRGSTPTLYFKVKNIEDFSTVVDIWITISPYGKNGGSLTKKIKDMKVDTAECVISLSLTQEETMLMGPVIEIQLKVLLESGQVVVSPIFERPVGRLLNWIPMYCSKPEEQPPSDVIIPGDGNDDPENPNPGSGTDPENPDSPGDEGGDPENPGGDDGNAENPDNSGGGSEPIDPPSGGNDGGDPDPDNPGEGGNDPVDLIPCPGEGEDPDNEPTPAPGDDGDVDIIIDEDY